MEGSGKGETVDEIPLTLTANAPGKRCGLVFTFQLKRVRYILDDGLHGAAHLAFYSRSCWLKIKVSGLLIDQPMTLPLISHSVFTVVVFPSRARLDFL